MKKILVPIDFSANSNKAIRFAIQFASQTKSEIVFLHVFNVMTYTNDAVWDFAYYSQFYQDEVKLSQDHLTKRIRKIYNEDLPSGVSYKCVCQPGTDTSGEIMSFAQKQKADFICVGATGTGFLSKLLGTVATHLIVNSPIPVFVIPKNYRLKPLVDICYASDMENPEIEIKKVLSLANELQAATRVLHFDYEIGLKENREKLTQIARKFETKNIHFQYKKLNALYPLNDHLRKTIETVNPSLLILFTKQNRSWYDRLTQSSNSVGMSFSTKAPLLVYRKTSKKTTVKEDVYQKLYNPKKTTDSKSSSKLKHK